MNKKLGLVVLAVLLCFVLAGCSESVIIKAGDTSYEVTGVRMEEEYAGESPQAGQHFLIVQALGEKADMDRMQEVFFNMDSERIVVTDGSTSIPCKSITYAASGAGQSPDITAVLLFEVPQSFPEQFTMVGDAFGSVSLTSSQSALDSITGAFQGSK